MHKFRRHRRRRGQGQLGRFAKYLDIAADFGVALLRVRDRPTLLDWVALATCGVNTTLKVREEVKSRRYHDPREFFDVYRDVEVSTWAEFPLELKQLTIKHAHDAVERDEGAGEGDDIIVTAKLGDEEVGWIVGEDGIEGGPYLHRERGIATARALGACIWRDLGVAHLRCVNEDIRPVAEALDDAFPRELVQTLGVRLGAFAKQSIPRSVLLEGPPGTGKSTAVRMIVRDLGFRSLHIDLRALAIGGEDVRASADISPRLRGWITVLRPDAVIIDDIDRVLDDTQLFDLLEWMSRKCKLVAATANVTENMAPALLRPGRFDEVIRVDEPEPALVRRLVGDDAAVFERVKAWPVAYVAEYAKRAKSLGREAAWSELDELEARVGNNAKVAETALRVAGSRR
jgi:adenylate kinase family enzyme